MANTVTGKIFSIGSTQTIPSKNGGQPFYKRDIVLDATRFDPYTGERGFENYPMFEFNGEKCKDLDGYQVGQVVTISFELQGSFFDASDGTKKNFTRVRGYKIEAKQMAAHASQPKVQQQPAPQQYQSQYPPQQQYQPQPTPPPPGMNDLPFPI